MFKSTVVVLLIATFAATSVFAAFAGNFDFDELKDAVDNANITVFASSKCNLRYSCFEGRHYYIETLTQRTRDDAARYCTALNMQLLSVENCEENAFITNALKSQPSCGNQNYWISAHQNGNGKWAWGNGAALTFTNWKLNEPNYKKDEYCVHYRYNFLQWNDEVCSKKFYFICESDGGCTDSDFVLTD